MKQIKKFLGVFLALAMVIGMVGMMPAVEAKAAENITASLEAPSTDVAVTTLVITFSTAIDGGPTRADRVFGLLKVNDEDLTSNLGGTGTATWNSTTKVTVEIPSTTFVAGDIITMEFHANYVQDEGENTVKPLTYSFASGSGSAVEFPAVTPAVEFVDSNLTLAIEGLNVKYIYFGIPKLKKGEQVVAAYDIFEMTNSSITIDLSVYGVKKDQEFWLHYGNTELMTVVKFAKNDLALKVAYVYDGENAGFAFTHKGTALTPAQIETLQYRVGSSTIWETYDAAELAAIVENASMFGTTIYFRQAATVGADNLTHKFPSAEAKIKVAKKGKSPKITIDYVNETISFPKAVQILGINSATEWKTFKELFADVKDVKGKDIVAGGVAKVGLSDVVTLGTTGTLFYVRTAAVAKKPSSKLTEVIVPAQNTAPTDLDAIVTVAEVVSRSKVTGAKLTNKSAELVIQYSINDAGKTSSELKWSKIAAGTTKSATLKLTDLKDKTVYFRVGGDKKTAVLPSGILEVSGNNIILQVDPPSLTWKDTEFKEGADNDGTVVGKATVTLYNATFVSSLTDITHYTVTGTVPSGLTLKVERKDDTTAEVTFTGTAATHAASNNVTDLKIVFTAAAFEGGVDIETNIATTLKITFDDPEE